MTKDHKTSQALEKLKALMEDEDFVFSGEHLAIEFKVDGRLQVECLEYGTLITPDNIMSPGE